MSQAVTEFIKQYLAALGIADADIEEYTAKVIFTAAGTALLALDDSDSNHKAFSAAIVKVEQGSESPFALLDRAFPDGRHHTLFRKAIIKTLLDTTISMAAVLDDGAKRKLERLIAGLA